MSHRYFRDVLPSGLRVVTVEAPHLRAAMVAAYVRVGSRHETPATSGVSHYLEHMFFRGSARYPDTVEMNARVEDAGGNLNGITTRDHGYYFTPVHPDQVGVGLDVLGDMLTRPRLRHLETERRIILEEMLDEVDERGRDIDLDNLSKRRLFAGHPLALKIAGTPETVRALGRRQLVDHFEENYVAGNLVVAVAGRVRRGEVVERTARAFRALPRGPATTEAPPPPSPSGPWLEHVDHGESQTEFRLSFRTVPERHPDAPVVQVLRRVLDDGLSSRLPYQVVERRGLAYSVHASLEFYDDVGLFEVDAASAPKSSAEVFDEVCRTLGGLCDRVVSGAELARAKRRHRMFLEFSEDSAGELAGWYGGTEIFHPPETFAERCRLVDAVTAVQVRDVARRLFVKRNLGVVAVGQRAGARPLRRAVKSCRGLWG